MQTAAKKLEGSVIQALINPTHPTKPNVKLQLGLNKRGRFVYFEPLGAGLRPDDWRLYRDCSDPEEAQAHLLDSNAELIHRQGPANCILVLHKSLAA